MTPSLSNDVCDNDADQCTSSIRGERRSNLREICHDTAISLNNTAVALLADGFAQDAADMLADVKQFMLSMSPSTSSSNPERETKLYHQVHAALQRACHIETASALAAQNETLSLHRLLTMSQWPMRLHVVSSQTRPAEVCPLVASRAASASACRCVFPMTIDPLKVDDERDAIRFYLAVVMHNYGIALQCVMAPAGPSAAMIQPSDFERATYSSLDRVRCLWRTTGALLFAMEQEQEGSSSHSSCAGPIQTLQLVLTHSLVYLALDLRIPDEYEGHQYALQRRLRSIQSQALRLSNPGPTATTPVHTVTPSEANEPDCAPSIDIPSVTDFDVCERVACV